MADTEFRSEDLAPLLHPQVEAPDLLRGGTGVVHFWDFETGENIIEFRGTLLQNVPTVLSSSEVGEIQSGDVVMLHLFGNRATLQPYVIGRIARPGPDVTTAVHLRTKAAKVDSLASTTSTDYTDLLTPGPEVTVLIGASGRCEVTLSAMIQFDVGVSPGNSIGGGYMSFRVDDGQAREENDAEALFAVVDGLTSSGLSFLLSMSRTILVEGLQAGEHKFSARYKAHTGSTLAGFSRRSIIVRPL